jgi:hypothetical protein
MEKTKQKNRIQVIESNFKNKQKQTNSYSFKVSYIIKEQNEILNRNGVNCLKYDSNNDRLYSAGRDSIIRVYNPSNVNFILISFYNSLSK